MPVLSYAVQAKLLNWLKGVDFGTPPTSLHLGLLTAAPNPDGTGVVEPSENAGYARVVITLGVIATSGGVSTVKNAGPLVFPAATADWPSLTYAAVFDQDGVMLASGPLPAARAPKAGDALSFGANAIQLRLR